MSVVPYIAVLGVVAVGLAEVFAFTLMKDDAPPSHRVQPE